MKRVGRESAGYAFDRALPPVLEVEQGESFWAETNDAHRGTVIDESVVYRTLEDTITRLGGANPVTGPVSVRGVRAGDCLVMTIEEIIPAPRTGSGYTCTTPTLDPTLEPETVICPLQDGNVVLRTASGDLRIPARPMIGTIACAPAGDPRPSFGQWSDILGNVDIPFVTAGATIVLRSGVDGGLVFLGDAHLAQGDAEIHRAAIEAEADVRLSVTATSADAAGFAELPQVNTAEVISSIAPGPGHLEDLVRAAYDDLAQRLVTGYGLLLGDAYRLLGSGGRVTVGQVVPPLASVAAALPTSLLPDRR